jgi:hypothetical protein
VDFRHRRSFQGSLTCEGSLVGEWHERENVDRRRRFHPRRRTQGRDLARATARNARESATTSSQARRTTTPAADGASLARALTEMDPHDVLHGARDLVLGERRTAAGRVPAQQEIQGDLGVNTVPEEMARERRDGVVALALTHPVSDRAGASAVAGWPAPSPRRPRSRSHEGIGASGVSSGRCNGAHAQRRPDGCTDGGATTKPPSPRRSRPGSSRPGWARALPGASVNT